MAVELYPAEFTPDDSRLIVAGRDPVGLFTIGLGGGEEPMPLAFATPSRLRRPTLSPDGRWLAYVNEQDGRLVPFVRRFDGAGRAVAIVDASVREPRWSRDGRELYCRQGVEIMGVTVSGTDVPEVMGGSGCDRSGSTDVRHGAGAAGVRGAGGACRGVGCIRGCSS